MVCSPVRASRSSLPPAPSPSIRTGRLTAPASGETFLTDELPNWLAANRGIAPGGNAIVGAAQGGTGAVTLAAFYPDRYRYAGSMSGYLTPSSTFVNGAISAGMNDFGGVNIQAMWGAPQLGRWKWHDPDVHVNLLAQNNTRLWIFSPQA